MENEEVRRIERKEELCCKDKEVQEVISELIAKKYKGSLLETKKGQRHYKAIHVANLLFKNTNKDKIDINFITDKIDYMNDNEEIRIFRDFIILLTDNGIINNNEILKFRYLPLSLYKIIDTKEIKRLIKKYINSNLWEILISQIQDMNDISDLKRISKGRLYQLARVVCYRTRIKFKNPCEKKLYGQYIEKYLHNKDVSYGAKTGIIERIDLTLEIMSKKEAKDITRQDLAKLFQDARISVPSVIYNYFQYLKDNGIEISKEIQTILSFRKYIDLLFIRLVLKDILKKEHIERWYFKKTKNRSHIKWIKWYINVPVDYPIYKTLTEFISKYNRIEPKLQLFLNEFLVPVENVKSINDLSYKTYIKHLNHFHKIAKSNCYVDVFYLYVYQQTGMDIFSDGPVATRILNLRGFGYYIVKGYRPVTYNPVADIPKEDKLIVWLSIKETRKNYNNANGFIKYFTKIKDTKYRKWVKSYFWKSTTKQLYWKSKQIHVYTNIFNDLSNIQEQYKIENDEHFDLTGNIIRIWKLNQLSQEVYATVARKCAKLTILLNYAKDYENAKIEDSVYYYLKNEKPIPKSNANPICDADLIKLLDVAAKKKNNSMKENMCFCLLYLLLYTDRRISELLDLERDCLQSSLKNGDNILKTETKTSRGEPLTYPISNETVKIIKCIKNLNSNIVDKCNDIRFKNKLFLFKTTRRNLQYAVITSNVFKKYLSKCCKEANINHYTAANLRDTYMTRVEDFRIKNGLSDMYDKVLTGHKYHSTTEKHYVKLDFKTMYEAAQGIIIGNVDLKGVIQKEIDNETERAENSVENDTGYCGNNTCNNMTYLSCYLCSHFVTSPRQLPQFEKQLEEINKQIEKADMAHDKKDLIAIKKLLIEYIIKIKEAMIESN